MLQRAITALILIPLVLSAVLLTPQWLFALLAAAVALLATREYLHLAEANKLHPLRALTYLFVSSPFLFFLSGVTSLARWPGVVGGVTAFAAIALFIAPFVALAVAMRRTDLSTVLSGAAASLFGVAYIAFPLASLPFIRDLDAGVFLLLFLLLVVWSGDVAGYFVGRSVGRHLLAPRISPKKTWEGAIGSVTASLAVGIAWAYFAPPVNPSLPAWARISQFEITHVDLWNSAVAALLINVAAQIGDLVESVLKRGAGVKDSGSLLPGHGGILDRIDALLFAAPVAMVLFLSGLQIVKTVTYSD